VVARDQQPAVGLVQRHVRRRVAGRLVDLPPTQVGLDLHAGQQVAVGRHEAVDPERLAAPRLVSLGDDRIGDPALPCHLDTPLEHALRVVQVGRHVGVVRVHPQLATGRVDDRAGQAVVVGMGVRADQEPDVLQAQARLPQRQLQLP
jgi:hypothetical protein